MSIVVSSLRVVNEVLEPSTRTTNRTSAYGDYGHMNLRTVKWIV